MTGPIHPSPAAPIRRGRYFDQVASLPQLRIAWERVQANKGAAGGDGVTVERFALVAESQLDMLARALAGGRYRPSPIRRVLVPKRSGGTRPLDIPSIIDRVAQAATAMVLDPVIDPHLEASSFAYRRGRSVAQAVARVAALRREGFTHVVDGDIKSYFERIPHERLIDKLERLVDDQALIDLVWLWLEAASLTGRGVPQGSPLSPLLANLYLDAVDEAMGSRGTRLVRFADDFLVLTKRPDHAERALEEVRGLLAEEGLELNLDKTQLVTFDQGFRFLGHVFVRSVVVKEVRLDETPPEDAVELAEAVSREADAADEPETDGRERADPIFPVYVLEAGKTLDARGARLIAVAKSGHVQDLPPGRIDRIELYPGTEATIAAFDMAAANAVEIVRVNGHGEPMFRVGAPAVERAARHLAQARALIDPERRRVLAQAMAEARVANQRALLRRLNRAREDAEVVEACLRLNRTIRKFRKPRSVEEAMGIEGEAAAVYWPALSRCFPEGARFSTRTRRPAPDAANIALNVVSDLLARDLRSLIVKSGLHPGFSVLHAVQDGRDSLVYDLMEAFRAPVVEACVAAAFNRRALTLEAHFDGGASRPRANRDGFAALVRGYESWMSRPVRSPRSGHDLLWRQLILEEVIAFGRACETGEDFVPYRMDY